MEKYYLCHNVIANNGNRRTKFLSGNETNRRIGMNFVKNDANIKNHQIEYIHRDHTNETTKSNQ